MRVWLIQTGEPVPLDSAVKRMRTALLADELARRGHRVVWWASAFDHGSRAFVARGGTTRTLGEGVEAHLLPALGYRKNVSLRRYVDHRYVARAFRSRLGGVDSPPHLVVAATPDHHIAAVAGDFAARLDIPYVVDLRDPWPDSFLDALPAGPLRAMGRVALSGDFAKLRRTLRGANGLVAMMQSMLDWGLGHAGRAQGSQDRVFYLGTEPLPPPDPSFLADLRASLGSEGRPTVVYVGTFGRYNHPEVLLQAVRHIRSSGGEPHFNVVVGGAGDLYGAIRQRYQDLPGVHFTGWLSAPQISAVLAVGCLGIVPWTSGIAFPNKAFSYLAAGLPVLTSAAGDLRQLVEDEGFGAYFEPGDASGLARLLQGLTGDPDTLSRMTHRAREIYPARFASEAIYRSYADYLETVSTP